MKPWKHTLWIVLAVLIIISLLLSACVTINIGGSSNNDKNKEKNKDNGYKHNNDKDANADKITICHKTGSAKHPYVEISVSDKAVKNGHARHKGDIIPAPKKGCPAQ